MGGFVMDAIGFGEAPPNISGLEIKEQQAAMEWANSIREWVEEAFQWMFPLGGERSWYSYVFTGAAAAAAATGWWLLSHVGSFSHLLTILYGGIVVGMTVPLIYVKYDYIWEYVCLLMNQCRRFYELIDEKASRKMKNKMAGEKKEKKIE
ncbi:unnamed protein product [Ilex paraguariensis]|uniref:Reticulon-like protein n=1 Tax=Ilex paraguariensis TaxID=185542 RepID=A0ABC8UXN1_9AQUA